MRLPAPRGPLSDGLFVALRGERPDRFAELPGTATTGDAIADDDVQLALYACYQLHYGGFDGVDDRWEWDPTALAFRRDLEARFEAALRTAAPRPADVDPPDVPDALARLAAGQCDSSRPGSSRPGSSLSKFVRRDATLGQFRELLMHRSLYHLREADPHTFAIPRLTGRAKAALIEIQVDEYGGGQLGRMHAELFRDTMVQLGLDPTPGAYLAAAPALTLATNNVMSLFALHRRLRGALLGQLAMFEMNSSLPNRRYGNGLRRLGRYPAAATRFFDEHVEADAVHEQIAAHDLCGAFCAAEPSQTSTVLFGAAAWLTVESRLNEHLLQRWTSANSSLRDLPPTDAA